MDINDKDFIQSSWKSRFFSITTLGTYPGKLDAPLMTSKYSQTNGIVMIVDDTTGNLALLSNTLSEVGYHLLVATVGLSALEQIAYLKPDIILLDVWMRGINGFKTCNRLKSEPETAHIPVLFMTALSELDDLLRGFRRRRC
jgi:CheY-like chemotaxis protein